MSGAKKSLKHATPEEKARHVDSILKKSNMYSKFMSDQISKYSTAVVKQPSCSQVES